MEFFGIKPQNAKQIGEDLKDTQKAKKVKNIYKWHVHLYL